MTQGSEGEPRLVDARGLKCPWPVLRAARAMRECDDILLLADDPVALIDVPALAKANGWALVLLDEGDHHSFQLSKTGH
ncbi:MAG: sulfurtransferase TusA family protein [Sphingobium sp.]|nr:sulfurtransferase TusA family protein [Sphingobium sp.]